MAFRTKLAGAARSLAASALRCLVSLTVFWGSAELLTRSFGYHGISVDFQPVTYARDLGWRLKPGLHETWSDLEWRVPYHTNSRGYRDVEHTAEAAPGAARILVLGDSMAEGWGVPFEAMWQSRLGSCLGERAEIVNLGVRGYDIIQEYKQLLSDGLPLQPKVVIQMLGPNDYMGQAQTTMWYHLHYRPAYNLREGRIEFREPPREQTYIMSDPLLQAYHRWLFKLASVTWLARNLASWSWIDGQVSANQQGIVPPAAEYQRSYDLNYPEAVRAIYSEIARLCAENGMRFLPVWVGTSEPIPSKLKEALGSVTQERHEIDLPPSLKFVYDVHPNIEGHRYIGESIAAFVAERTGLTNSCTKPGS